jgi:hypothetical protein
MCSVDWQVCFFFVFYVFFLFLGFLSLSINQVSDDACHLFDCDSLVNLNLRWSGLGDACRFLNIAACSLVDIFIVSRRETRTTYMVDVYSLRDMRLLHTIGRTVAAATAATEATAATATVIPVPFKFELEGYGVSGMMAFAGPACDRLVLVTDSGNDCVHVIRVPGCVHAGFLCDPGSLGGPRGVAAHGSMVAVSSRQATTMAMVTIFDGSLETGWSVQRKITKKLDQPYGLRFARDGHTVVVAEKSRVIELCTKSGAFVRNVFDARGTGETSDTPETISRDCEPVDVEWCQDRWLVLADYSPYIYQAKEGCSLEPIKLSSMHDQSKQSLAFVPDLGLFLAECWSGVLMLRPC